MFDGPGRLSQNSVANRPARAPDFYGKMAPCYLERANIGDCQLRGNGAFSRSFQAARRCLPSGLSFVLEDDMPDRGVRRGDVIEAINLLHIVIERAAHDQPHDQFHALGPGLAHVF